MQDELDDQGPELEEETQPMHTPSKNRDVVICPSETRHDIQKQISFVKDWYSPSKDKGKAVAECIVKECPLEGNSNDSSDSDYLPGDDCPSEDDEEVIEILEKFKEFKKRLQAGQVANLDDVVLDRPKEVSNLYEIEDEGNVTPYANSSDDEDSIEEYSGGDIQRGSTNSIRFSMKEAIPKFEIGMKFSGKKQFKKACIKHGLVERKFIKFLKNESSRMIAVCDWATCSWRCMASVNSKSSSWQIASYNPQKKFWACAKAPCVTLFNLAKARLSKETKGGAEAIMNTDPHHWSRAWFRLGSFCDSVDNNMCESFNKWIVDARYFPIITMLETIRRKVMVRIQQNRSKYETWNTIICPNILKKLNAYITLSGVCHAVSNGNDQYEVTQWTNRFTVDLNKNECSCRYWQLSGLPCPHAISCIFFKTNDLSPYIASCYSVNEFMNTYKHCLMPVEGMHSWPVSEKTPLNAPGYVRMPGRPKKERRREPTEKPKAGKISRVGTIIRCRKCNQVGHNRSTCDKRNSQHQTPVDQKGNSTTAAQTSTASSKKRTTTTSNSMQNKRSKQVGNTCNSRTTSLILDIFG